MTQTKSTPPKPPQNKPSPEPPAPEPEDKILTVRLAPELYEIIVAEAKAARHSINSAATILLEEALLARGKWEPPKEKMVPFWLRKGTRK